MDLSALSSPPWLTGLVAAAVLVTGLVVWGAMRSAHRRREREELRRRYGTEYERTLAMHRSTRAAIADLREREQLHQRLQLSNLNAADRALLRRHMATLQYRFVEDPTDVLRHTERVVAEVLRTKGYPVDDDREQALRVFSVDHPAHAGSVHALLDGSHHGDVERMRAAFLQARAALAEIAGLRYALGDALDAPADLRIEHTLPTPVSAGGPSHR